METKAKLVYQAKPLGQYLKTHAANPLVVPIKSGIFRIFFSSRNEENRSSVAFIDFDIDRLEPVADSFNLLIPFGDPDSFYSDGISVGCHVQYGGENSIYFMGWKVPMSEHWYGLIGKINLDESLSNAHIPAEPILSLNEDDPISLSYPFILIENGIYKMWYGSTISWDSENGEMVHVIKYAESQDGKNWERKGVAIPYEIGIAQAFSRPSVLKINNVYHMWYSYRSGDGTPYRIGYSTSIDGLVWERKHEQLVGIGLSDWDNHMQCYPFAVYHNGCVYLFYNGNNYGRDGFGVKLLSIT